MAITLIQKILNSNTTNPEQFSNLDALLQTAPGVFLIDGGLGKDYKKIRPFLTVNPSNIITAIDSENILALAIKFWEQKMVYQAGICFALIALYGDTIPKKIQSYKQLFIFFENKKYLDDPSMAAYCQQHLKAASNDGSFVSTYRIAWSWEIQDKDGMLAYEEQRQKNIARANPSPLERSLLLLGLVNDKTLDTTKIQEAASLLKAKLQTLFNLSPLQVKDNPLNIKFIEAANILRTMVHFNSFNHQTLLRPLIEKIAQVKDQLITDPSLFKAILVGFKQANSELEAMVATANNSVAGDGITQEIIKARLGRKITLFGQNRFEQQEELTRMAHTYWAELAKKITPLINKADSLLTNIRETQSLLTDRTVALTENITEIEAVQSILSDIQGDTTVESSSLLDLMNSEEAKRIKTKLTYHLTELRTILQQQEEQLTQKINDIITLNHSLLIEPEPDLKGLNLTDLISLAQKTTGNLSQINTHVTYFKTLNQLDNSMKRRVENKIAEHILQQANCETVTNAVSAELQKLSATDRVRSMQLLVGRSYNKLAPIDYTLNVYFKNKSAQGESLNLVVKTFVGMLRDNDINLPRQVVENLVPAPVNMTLPLVMQQLATIQAKLTDLLAKLQTQIKTTLQEQYSSLLRQHTEVETAFNKLLSRKNQFKFADWRTNVTAILQSQETLLARYQSLDQQLSALSRGRYLESSLITPMQQQFIAKKQSLERQNSTIKAVNTERNVVMGQYTAIRSRIFNDKKGYESGKHHPDRLNSLERLVLQIDSLDANDNLTIKERIEKLLAQVHLEEMSTANSHAKLSFFSSLRLCRLQKIYLQILSDFSKLDRAPDSSAAPTIAPDKEHQKRLSLFPPQQQVVAHQEALMSSYEC